MSGNLIFYKTPEPLYELVFDYSNLLNPGETLKDCIVYVNGTEISGTYEDRYNDYVATTGSYDSIFTFDPDIYDNETILVTVNSGVLTSGYTVAVSGITNRRALYGRAVDVFIDEYAYPDVYRDFEYRFLVDMNNIYILPALYETRLAFPYNTEYTVNIDSSIKSVTPLYLERNESFWFTSKYCPMFTNATAIILLLGPEAEKFTVDTINRYIHRTSKEAIDLINMSGSCGGAPRVTYDHYGCTPNLVPYNLRRYVECKVAYDLLNLLDRLRTVGGSDCGQTKTLGDMTIKYGGASTGTASNDGPKKDLYDCFTGLQGILSNNPTLCGTGAGINNGVRGKYDTSKGYAHPTRDPGHNRIQPGPVPANGPWYNNGSSRYPSKGGF